MKIGLWNLEPKYVNLAIEKLRCYYTARGNEVEDYFALAHYDKVYVSSIFTFTKKHAVLPNMMCGGTGFNLTTKLPPEIEDIQPRLNMGFTTRGCPNNCPFCVVPIKEGKPYIVCKLKELWDGKGKLITLMDNNILALPNHFIDVCQESLDLRLKLDFNQGLDHRRLTPEIINMLHRISHVEYRFAFDSPAYYKSVESAIKLLKEGGINRSLWYVLVGFNTTFQEDLERLNFLRDKGQRAYVQRFCYGRGDNRYALLAEWSNRHHLFGAMTWEQFMNPDRRRRAGRSKKSSIPAYAVLVEGEPLCRHHFTVRLEGKDEIGLCVKCGRKVNYTQAQKALNPTYLGKSAWVSRQRRFGNV